MLATAAIIVVVALAAFAVWRVLRFRGERVVVCPETKQTVGVALDPWLAAGTNNLRLSTCTRWPEKADCDQSCVSQIAGAPDGTLMRNIVAGWYRESVCSFCSRPIGEVQWHDPMPALRTPDGSLRGWSGITGAELPPRRLPQLRRGRELPTRVSRAGDRPRGDAAAREDGALALHLGRMTNVIATPRPVR
jgi:hypothetical protein